MINARFQSFECADEQHSQQRFPKEEFVPDPVRVALPSEPKCAAPSRPVPTVADNIDPASAEWFPASDIGLLFEFQHGYAERDGKGEGKTA